MVKKLYNLIKKVIIAIFMLYAFNVMVSPINIIIPINIVTVLFGSFFGIFSIPFLVILMVYIF